MKTTVISGSYVIDVVRVDEVNMNLKERFLLTGIHSMTDIVKQIRLNTVIRKGAVIFRLKLANVYPTCSWRHTVCSDHLWGAEIAQWLQRRSRDQKVLGSSPGWCSR